MRSKIVAGNWKMNNDLKASKLLANGLVNRLKDKVLNNTKVIIAPSFISLNEVRNITENSIIEVAAQTMHEETCGAYTGEVSGEMLVSAGVKCVILGHSERREYFGESDSLIFKKIKAALSNKLEVIFCFGEVLEDRKSGAYLSLVESQITNALFSLEPSDWDNIILAYEPVWAIGTGETATAEQAQEMHSFVRGLIAKKYNNDLAQGVSILYGGSCKPTNAKEIFSKEDVDGGLIGGCALKEEDFMAIIEAIQ